MAPLASAGQNGGWGKGKNMLSETLLFDVDSGGTGDESGYMNWNPEAPEFKYDFHGNGLVADEVYYLKCYKGEIAVLELGWCTACVGEDPECDGVHIKGVMPWPGLGDVTIQLVLEDGTKCLKSPTVNL